MTARVPVLRSLMLLLAAVCPALSHAQGILPDIGFEPSVTDTRAQVVPQRSTVLSSGLAGRIAELSLREGDRFVAGERLVGLDCTLHYARQAKAQAQVEESLKTHEANARLGELRSISHLEVEVAAARLAAAQAELGVMEALVELCDIKAPFNGRVARLDVRRYQYVAEGEPLLEILDDSALEVEMIVPSRWLSWLRPDIAFTIHIEETGLRYPARVDRIGARIDPVSQSVKIFALIEAEPAGLLAGMSGSAAFSQAQ